LTRAEIRRNKRELERKHILTGAQLKEHEDKLLEKATYQAFVLFLGLGTLGIKYHFGKLIKKENRETNFINLIMDLYHSHETDEISIEKLKQVIRDHSDIEDIKEAI
jgi:hypothetical protein